MKGTHEDVYRRLRTYWTLDGELLGQQHDDYAGEEK